MISFLISSIAFACFVSASRHSQKILDHHDGPSNFIQSSIFGKRFKSYSLSDPVTLPPTYQNRVFEDENAFDGIGTFAHLDFTECTNSENSGTFDIGIVGHPFDLGVSYRPGARFGPNGARQGARRISAAAGWEYVTWQVRR
jgi:agmatinase